MNNITPEKIKRKEKTIKPPKTTNPFLDDPIGYDWVNELDDDAFLDLLLRGLARKETDTDIRSHKNIQQRAFIRNPDSGAIGMYQVMDETLNAWSKQYGIPKKEFLSNPDKQTELVSLVLKDKIQQYRKQGLTNKQILVRVPHFWYSGAEYGTRDLYRRYKTGKRVYPSLYEYITSFLSISNQYKPEYQVAKQKDSVSLQSSSSPQPPLLPVLQLKSPIRPNELNKQEEQKQSSDDEPLFLQKPKAPIFDPTSDRYNRGWLSNILAGASLFQPTGNAFYDFGRAVGSILGGFLIKEVAGKIQYEKDLERYEKELDFYYDILRSTLPSRYTDVELAPDGLKIKKKTTPIIKSTQQGYAIINPEDGTAYYITDQQGNRVGQKMAVSDMLGMKVVVDFSNNTATPIFLETAQGKIPIMDLNSFLALQKQFSSVVSKDKLNSIIQDSTKQLESLSPQQIEQIVREEMKRTGKIMEEQNMNPLIFSGVYQSILNRLVGERVKQLKELQKQNIEPTSEKLTEQIIKQSSVAPLDVSIGVGDSIIRFGFRVNQDGSIQLVSGTTPRKVLFNTNFKPIETKPVTDFYQGNKITNYKAFAKNLLSSLKNFQLLANSQNPYQDYKKIISDQEKLQEANTYELFRQIQANLSTLNDIETKLSPYGYKLDSNPIDISLSKQPKLIELDYILSIVGEDAIKKPVDPQLADALSEFIPVTIKQQNNVKKPVFNDNLLEKYVYDVNKRKKYLELEDRSFLIIGATEIDGRPYAVAYETIPHVFVVDNKGNRKTLTEALQEINVKLNEQPKKQNKRLTRKQRN